MGDPNMNVARGLGLGLGLRLAESSALPSALLDIDCRTQLVLHIDALGPLLVGFKGELQWVDMGRRLEAIAAASASLMTDVPHPLDQVSVALRLWAGCLDAVKTIALETRSGPNVPLSRAAAFGQHIDPIAAADEVYRAGVEVAPKFLATRGQGYDLDGVPADSPVRRFAS